MTGQVEEGMVGEVENRWLVGRRLVLDSQLVVVGQRVNDADIEVARVSFFTVFGVVGEGDR
jgi:hypothetical protein